MQITSHIFLTCQADRSILNASAKPELEMQRERERERGYGAKSANGRLLASNTMAQMEVEEVGQME